MESRIYLLVRNQKSRYMSYEPAYSNLKNLYFQLIIQHIFNLGSTNQMFFFPPLFQTLLITYFAIKISLNHLFLHKSKVYNQQNMFVQNPKYANFPTLRTQPPLLHAPQGVPEVIYSNKKLQHINCVLPETEEQGGLYIGDTISTLVQQHINNNKIEAILCLNSQAVKNVRISRSNFQYKQMEIQDHPQYPIKLHFESANQFIQANRKNKKNVLVQCHAGVSRSATIVCAYLIKHKSWIPEQAIYYLKQKRQRAKPNAGFWKQLEQYWNGLNPKGQSSSYDNNKIKDQVKYITPVKENIKVIQEEDIKTAQKQQKVLQNDSSLTPKQKPVRQNSQQKQQLQLDETEKKRKSHKPTISGQMKQKPRVSEPVLAVFQSPSGNSMNKTFGSPQQHHHYLLLSPQHNLNYQSPQRQPQRVPVQINTIPFHMVPQHQILHQRPIVNQNIIVQENRIFQYPTSPQYPKIL